MIAVDNSNTNLGYVLKQTSYHITLKNEKYYQLTLNWEENNFFN